MPEARLQEELYREFSVSEQMVRECLQSEQQERINNQE